MSTNNKSVSETEVKDRILIQGLIFYNFQFCAVSFFFLHSLSFFSLFCYISADCVVNYTAASYATFLKCEFPSWKCCVMVILSARVWIGHEAWGLMCHLGWNVSLQNRLTWCELNSWIRSVINKWLRCGVWGFTVQQASFLFALTDMSFKHANAKCMSPSRCTTLYILRLLTHFVCDW